MTAGSRSWPSVAKAIRQVPVSFPPAPAPIRRHAPGDDRSSLQTLFLQLKIYYDSRYLSYQGYLGGIPKSLCASLRIERSVTSLKVTSRVTLAAFFACSITRRSPSSGRLPSSLKAFQTDS